MANPVSRRVGVLLLLALILAAGAGSVRGQDSPHGKLSFACEECHVADSWKEMPVPAKFNHARTGFTLKGQHGQVKCTDCHAGLTFKFKKSASRCADCHSDVHRGELGATCDRCHSPQSWLVPDMVQRHSSTRFSLVGAHATVPCQECHTSQQKNEYVGLRTDCFGCHQQDYDGTQAPNHRQSGIGTDCQSCHALNAMNWGVSGVSFGGSFDHAKTGFPLVGGHAALACVQCHAGNVFRAASTQCMSCHTQDFAAAKAPPHTGFASDCSTCHTMTAWQPATFNHATTPFPLTGGHLAVAPCVQCHVNNVYAGLSMTCYSCHQAQFTGAVTPVPHSGFPTDCSTCHSTNPGWAPSTFNHQTSSFPLVGAHVTIACAQCHVNNRYVGLATTCYGCHQQDFTAANAPPHTGFATDCTTCHTNTAWQPATFNHANTPFPLTGGHLAVAPCAQCHVNNVYAGLSMTCYSCHQVQFTGATTPVPHTGFPTDCSTCHTTNPGWAPSTFNHQTSSFPLVGAHLTLACAQCHVNNNYISLATTCYGCHQTQFTTANAPPHTGFSTDCTTCHTNTAWQPATFNHANTPFPLTGAHLTVTPCTQCHVNNVYAGLPVTCYSCHQAQFTGATAPVPHAGFPTDCSTCHTTNAGWTPSTFNHQTSSFPLTGAHAAVACTQCHVNNNYTTLATTCYGCHQKDFTSANAPPHTGFSTDCTTCHTNTAWQPATFNHANTPFPLTGGHTSVACAQCHVNNVYVGLTHDCYTCHTTTFTSATTPVPHTGFPAANCATCHTTNPGWAPSTYSHSTATPRFPQDNRHTTAACAKCHQTATNYTQYCCQSSGCHNSCAGAN